MRRLWGPLLALACACGRDDRAPAAAGSTGAASAEPSPPPVVPSRFDVPLEYDFTPVMQVVERAVPTTFGSMDSVRQVGPDARRHYAFEATRGPFTAFVVDSLVHLRARLSYTARGYYKPRIGPTLSAGCGKGDDRPEIIVELVTPLTIDSEWRLKSRARLERLEPASPKDEDRCKVSLVRVDVTDRVVDAARRALSSRLRRIDRMVNRIDLTTRATRWWALLERPIRLTDDVWLELRPQRLRVGRVTGTGRVLTVQAGLDALPRVTVGPEPTPVYTALPPLAHDSTGGGFHMSVDGVVDYTTASLAMTEALRGRSISKAGRSVAVRSVVVSPADRGRLALDVGFAGDASGRLRLVGTPGLDASRGNIVVPDLDYDLSTDDGLVNAVAWVKGDDLRALLRERARVPVAPVLDRGRTLLSKGLNRTVGGVMTLSALVDSVSAEGIFVSPAGVMVRAAATGTARVAVRPKTRD